MRRDENCTTRPNTACRRQLTKEHNVGRTEELSNAHIISHREKAGSCEWVNKALTNLTLLMFSKWPHCYPGDDMIGFSFLYSTYHKFYTPPRWRCAIRIVKASTQNFKKFSRVCKCLFNIKFYSLVVFWNFFQVFRLLQLSRETTKFSNFFPIFLVWEILLPLAGSLKLVSCQLGCPRCYPWITLVSKNGWFS